MVEGAFALLLIVVLLIGAIEIGRMLYAYNILSYAADEGARLGSNITGLSRNSSGSGHSDIRARVSFIVSQYSLPIRAGYTVVSGCTGGGGGSSSSASSMSSSSVSSSSSSSGISATKVFVNIEATFQGLFIKYDGHIIRVTQSAPYLAANNCAP